MRLKFLAPALLLLGTIAHAEPWTFDAAHSRVGFSVRHMMVSSVDGRFHDVKANVDLDDKNLPKSTVEFTIAASSIDTANADRDKHLKSPDFFDVAKFPNLTFKSTKITAAGKNKYKVTGDLTIRDQTKPVTLDVTLTDAVANPWGKMVRGVEATGKLNRHDFGLNWNKTLDKGGVLVADEVKLDISGELDK
ncbi:MAG TPA: YceI family protein [Polyangiaceae bacterium]|jgi:polyisoprenoid-binding protein YceI|nr:YceI family protein [Polyangiaceae bacterium]